MCCAQRRSKAGTAWDAISRAGSARAKPCEPGANSGSLEWQDRGGKSTAETPELEQQLLLQIKTVLHWQTSARDLLILKGVLKPRTRRDGGVLAERCRGLGLDNSGDGAMNHGSVRAGRKIWGLGTGPAGVLHGSASCQNGVKDVLPKACLPSSSTRCQ